MHDVAFKAVKTLLWHAVVAARWWALVEPSDVQKICKGDLRLNKRSEAWWSLNVYYIIILIIGEMMWNNASSDKLCFWLLLASLALSTVLGIGKPLQCFVFVSSFGTEGFPFDLRNVPAPVKVCSALLGASKETSVKERWWITVSPSLQFCDQSTELRNGSLGGGDGRAYELEIIS